MGNQIIEQPDGLLAVFSTITDSFDVVDATDEDIIEMFVQEAADEARERVTKKVAEVRDPEARPYYQFGIPYEQALDMHRKTLKARQVADEDTEQSVA